MQTTIEILGKQVLVEWSSSADKKLQELAEPLIVEMELYFSCLIRKAVASAAMRRRQICTAAPRLRSGFVR